MSEKQTCIRKQRSLLSQTIYWFILLHWFLWCFAFAMLILLLFVWRWFQGEQNVFGEILLGQVARPYDAWCWNSSTTGNVDQVDPGPPVQSLVVHVCEDVLVPLRVVPVQTHLMRPAVRPTHVRVVDRSSERPRKKSADECIVDPEELDVERHAVHGDGHIGREDVAHPRAVRRVKVIRQLFYRDAPLSFPQDVHAPEDETGEHSQAVAVNVYVTEVLE